MGEGHGVPGHTRAEKSEGTVKSVLIEVTEDSFVGLSDLLEGAEDDEQETSVPFGNLVRVPLGSGRLVAVPSSGGTNCCSSGETTRKGQVNTGREKRVDEATGVTSQADVWAGISTSAVGPVGRTFDVGDKLAITDDFQDAWYALKTIEIIVLARRGTHFSLSLGCHGLVADYTNGGGAIVQGNRPDPATGI